MRWVSLAYGPVQCMRKADDHPTGVHEYWPSRKARRKHPHKTSWVAVGITGHPLIDPAPAT